MAEIRRFTKEDWYAWAGAEKFKDGSNPFIYTQSMNGGEVELTVIAEHEGIQIIMIPSNYAEDDLDWIKQKSLTSIQAEGEMRALVKALKKYDYAPDLSYALDHGSEAEFIGFENINC